MSDLGNTLGIEHVFVLMLENRSFDHMLGFSGITGTDAASGLPTEINGLTGAESNSFNGQVFPVQRGADNTMPVDPGHEFPNVLHQLCGPAVQYNGGPYPATDNSGFVTSYAGSGGTDNPGEVMKCYLPEQLPVLNALAKEFVVCDNWHASLPGPTWPNRMFVHAASSNGLEHSPSTIEIAKWEALAGFNFPNGTIFDALKQKGVKRLLYGGDDFPMMAALKGIHLDDILHYSLFANDVVQAEFPYRYIFIEPSYDVLHDYRDGSSQHPLGDVRRGEALIKATYEAVRNSPLWPSSLLIITWDEHGGFFDHANPPAAIAPGDSAPHGGHNQSGFLFDCYGPRVPGIVISPRIAKNVVDHRLYDHSSIPATAERLFGFNAMTARDAAANSLETLVTLTTPREDAPATLPAVDIALSATAAQLIAATPVTRPADTANQGSLPAIVSSAMQQELAAFPEERTVIVARVATIQTRADAMEYLASVQARLHPQRQAGAAR